MKPYMVQTSDVVIEEEIILAELMLQLLDWKEVFLDILKIGNMVIRKIAIQMAGLLSIAIYRMEILRISGFLEVEDIICTIVNI